MKRKISKRAAGLLVCLILVIGVAVGGALAYVFTKPPTVENEFTPAQVSCAVVETFENNVKENVRIRNTGDATAYIRVTMVVTWKYQDSDGIDHVYAQAPVENVDYAISYANDPAWLQAEDGFWYYIYPVACEKEAASADETLTSTLLQRVEQLAGATVPDGYHLSVEIVASAIQAYPSPAAGENWGLIVDQNGVVTDVDYKGGAV